MRATAKLKFADLEKRRATCPGCEELWWIFTCRRLYRKAKGLGVPSSYAPEVKKPLTQPHIKGCAVGKLMRGRKEV